MRTHKCGELNTSHLDQEVYLCGWVHRRRDHGGVIFIDLRDRAGRVQVVFDPDVPEIFSIAESVRSEYVLRVHGKVRRRPEGTLNANLRTGEIEVLASGVEILNKSETPPFPLEGNIEVNEETRLRYRYIDLRRTEMQDRIRKRRDIIRCLRNFLDEQEFYEIETPFLTKATPEGARDYLVPSRTHENAFFALPQSPQLYKQLLMISGMDRYYQVVRCFRDEDLRAGITMGGEIARCRMGRLPRIRCRRQLDHERFGFQIDFRNDARLDAGDAIIVGDFVTEHDGLTLVRRHFFRKGDGGRFVGNNLEIPIAKHAHADLRGDVHVRGQFDFGFVTGFGFGEFDQFACR